MSNEPSPNQPDLPVHIELEEVPDIAPRRARAAHADIAPRELAPDLGLQELPEEDQESPSWHAVKQTVRRGWFDPFREFEREVDWARFRRSQGFLVAASLVGPLLATLVLSLLAALIYSAIAALVGFTPPNPFYEQALYPCVFILAKGYWVAYLVLPLAVLVTGWLWAAGTAWNLTRDLHGLGFGKVFCILALLGSMYAPFVMFPFVRLLVLGILVWFVANRMALHFDFSFLHLVKRGGLLLLVLAAGYTWFEWKVQSWFPAHSELSDNLSAFYNSKRKLEWPAFRAPHQATPLESMRERLGSMDPDVRDRAVKAAQAFLNRTSETPEDRFQLGLRMAELGIPEGMVYAAKALQTGQGTRADAGQALAWIGRAVEENPKNLDYAMTMASFLVQDKRGLEGKRMFVRLAKANLNDLNRITGFLRSSGCGGAEPPLSGEVNYLYRMDTSGSSGYATMNAARGGCYYGGVHYADAVSLRQSLLQRLTGLDPDPWFWRALVTEYGGATQAEAEVYGEKPEDLSSDEALQRGAGDPASLVAAGDQLAAKGDPVRARQCWLKATLALDSDQRGPNAPIYLKLAQSADAPGSGAKPGEAARYYLGYLLLAQNPGNTRRTVIDALKRLGVAVSQDVDPGSPAFFALCARHDLPEGLVMVGCDHLGGSVNHTPKDLAKARTCFQRARELGYRGPAVR